MTSTTFQRKTVPAAEAQERLLAAVDELFYREGARAVGIEAVVRQAGVNKMSLYRQFESKDGLLLHYLNRRDERVWAFYEASFAKHPGQPRAQLLQLFADLAARTRKRNYRGCPFVNAAVEFPDPAHPARRFVAATKARLLARLEGLARDAGAKDPALLARSLSLLIEGAYAASQTHRPNGKVLEALVPAAQALIDAHC